MPLPPSIVSGVRVARPFPAVIVSLPPSPETTRLSTLGVVFESAAGRERDRLAGAVRDDLDRVVGGRAVVAGRVGVVAAVEVDLRRTGDADGRS